EEFIDLRAQMEWPSEPLQEILLAAIKAGDAAAIKDERYAAIFGMRESCTTGGIWRRMMKRLSIESPEIDSIVTKGTLARRIMRAVDRDLSRENVARVYGTLC